jgi:hypothetical protein
MKNVQMTVKGTILTITADLSKSQGDSKSKKTEILATTSGGIPVPGVDATVINLNIYKTK